MAADQDEVIDIIACDLIENEYKGTADDLALYLSKTAAARIVKTLERKGYVVRKAG